MGDDRLPASAKAAPPQRRSVPRDQGVSHRNGLSRRALIGGGVVLVAGGALAVTVLRAGAAGDNGSARYLRIATGSAAGTYFPVGETLARLLSHPPGRPDCDAGTPCGVDGLVVSAETSEGSVVNVRAVAAGTVETALAQADVTYWAQTGTGLFKGKPALANLRVIANLYPESLQLVVARKAGIRRIEELKGKRVSLDRDGSGSRVDARLILKAFGIREKDLAIRDADPSQATDSLADGELDAFFFVGGTPTPSIADLAARGLVDLLPLTGPVVERLTAQYAFFRPDVIPAGTYDGIAEIATVKVGAQWVVAAEIDEALVYALTRALFDPANGHVLKAGHPRAADIAIEHALDGVAIPLHPGAARFYREQGLKLSARDDQG